jgi:type I restriction enzyme M protein
VDGPALVERDASGQVVAVNLDIKNPNAKVEDDHRTPSEIVESALTMERKVAAILEELKVLIGTQVSA